MGIRINRGLIRAAVRRAAMSAVLLTTLAAMAATAGAEEITAAASWPEQPSIGSDYGCLMDADSGAVLFDKGKDVAMPPASLTKIMTVLLAIEEGDLDAQVTMTETGVAYNAAGSSNLYTEVGEVFTLRDMLYGVMLKSANDLATQVGEYIGGGSIENFCDMMNKKALELGCLHTHFSNACGMPADDHMTTAYDLCLISQEALKNETFREIIATTSYTIPATNIIAARPVDGHHPFMNGAAAPYEGFIGGKTGYTDAAMNTLASYAVRDGRTLIAVTLHGAGTEVTAADARTLLDYGFSNFRNVDYNGGGSATPAVVTIPQAAPETDIEVEVTDKTGPDGRREVLTTYTYEGRTVGSAALSPEIMEALEKKEEAVKARQEAEDKAREDVTGGMPQAALQTPSGGAAGTVDDGDSIHGVITDAPEADYMAGEPATINTRDEAMHLPFGITMGRTAFIAIAALALLILLGLLMIIITLIGRNNEDEE